MVEGSPASNVVEACDHSNDADSTACHHVVSLITPRVRVAGFAVWGLNFKADQRVSCVTCGFELYRDLHLTACFRSHTCGLCTGTRNADVLSKLLAYEEMKIGC